MGISEFTLHNVLRTYSRQERLGQVQRGTTRKASAARPNDQVSLSPTGRKVQWLGQFAAELVERQEPGLGPEERGSSVRSVKQELLERHRTEIGDQAVTPEELEARVRDLYAT